MRSIIKRGLVFLVWGLLICGTFYLLWRFPTLPLSALTVLQGNPLLLGAITIGLFLLILWRLPKWQVSSLGLEPKDRAKQEGEFRRTLAQILGGAVVLTGIYFSMENLRNTEKSLRVSREGQITDRSTKAIYQLGEKGDDKLPVRLGGISALEQISEDPEAADKYHWPVMEVLTAYIREESLRKEETRATANENLSATEEPKEKNRTYQNFPLTFKPS